VEQYTRRRLMQDLVEQLQALARSEHDDHSICNDAADEIERLRRELKELTTPLPCTHPVLAVQHGDEGTNYCRICELEGRVRQLQQAQQVVMSEREELLLAEVEHLQAEIEAMGEY
jgi:hypothetical protein